MPRKQPDRLTPLEATIMDCLWRLGSANVRQVQQSLGPERELAYTTVLTMMRILRGKKFLVSKRQGRVDIYRPLVSRERVARSSLHELIRRFFAGSTAALVSKLLESEDLSHREIQAIRHEVDARLGKAESTGEQ